MCIINGGAFGVYPYFSFQIRFGVVGQKRSRSVLAFRDAALLSPPQPRHCLCTSVVCHTFRQMRTLTIFILLCITSISWGQSTQTENNRFLTYDQNENWITITKSLDKSGQWNAIKERFFYKENQNISVDSIQYSPLIVINGVPLNISNKLTDKETSEILNVLNEDSINELFILDKLTEEWTFCKPFSGVIILTVDKKTDKKLYKLKLG